MFCRSQGSDSVLKLRVSYEEITTVSNDYFYPASFLPSTPIMEYCIFYNIYGIGITDIDFLGTKPNHNQKTSKGGRI